MSKSTYLRIDDFRAVLRLVGECRDLGDDPAAWQLHLFKTLGRILGAGLATSGEMEGLLAGRAVFRNAEFWGWENGFKPELYFQVLTAVMKDPSDSLLINRGADRLRQEAGAALTRTDLASNAEWEVSADCKLARLVGVSHPIASFQMLPGADDLLSALCLWRAAGERDFTPRERVLLREVHAAIVPLVGGPLARPGQPSPTSLAPRVRQVLRGLLAGDGDKQIAARMGLTRHTVNQYAKALFRHFGVQSRAELLALWVRRGFPARFSWEDE
jgi:DNA-binding CsgD family transcriptional regulator